MFINIENKPKLNSDALSFVKDKKVGELVITQDCIRSVRPRYGLAPNHLEAVIKQVAKQDVKQEITGNWKQIK